MLSENYILSLIQKKDISENTKKLYSDNIRRLKRFMKYEKDDFDFLLKHEDVMGFLEEKYKNKASSIKTYLITIYSILKESKINTTLKRKYKTSMEKYRDLTNNKIKENKPSTKESDNFMEFTKIQEKSEEIYKKLVDMIPGNNPSEVDLKTFANKRKKNTFLTLYSDYITIYYLSHTPPTRLENFNVFFTDKILDKKRENYIYLDSFNAIYYLKKYKNVKKLGEIKITFTRDMSKVLNDYYTFLKTNNLSIDNKYYLFTTFKGGKPSMYKTSNSFGQYIKRVFNKYFKKKITINDLRHIYTTELMSNPDYHKMSINEKEKLHQKLLHNKETGEQYFKLYEMTSTSKYNKEIDYDNVEELKKILQKHGYNLKVNE